MSRREGTDLRATATNLARGHNSRLRAKILRVNCSGCGLQCIACEQNVFLYLSATYAGLGQTLNYRSVEPL